MLLLRYGLKHHLSHRFRLLMVLTSLALGVAIFVSSYASVIAAETAIAAGAQSLAPKAQWEVSQGRYSGVALAVAEKIRKLPGAVAEPVVETTVSTAGKRPQSVLVIGVDLLSPNAQQLFGGTVHGDISSFAELVLRGTGVVITSGLARSAGVTTGGAIPFNGANGVRRLTVQGVVDDKRLKLAAGGNVAIMNLNEAASCFGAHGQPDKIEVLGATKQEIGAICPTCQIEPPGQLGSAAEDALNRIRSLLGISVIALLVGVLLIYNSVQVSVMERLQDMAILRAIGATRRQILGVLLTEWLVIGFVGSCLGLAIGSGLAIALIDFTKRTVNTMVPLVDQAQVQIGTGLCCVSVAIGLATTLAAAFFPAWAASKVRPLEILRPYSYRRAHSYWPATWAGIVLFALANVAVAVFSISYDVGIGITGLEFFGIALLFPQVVTVVGRPLRGVLAKLKKPGPFLALDGLLKAPHRTAFTIMTFGCALMMTVATQTLVGGFKASTSAWMNSAFPFDVSVMGNDLAGSVYGSQTLSSGLAGKIRSLPGVTDAYAVRKLFTPYGAKDVMAIGVDTDRYLAARRHKRMGYWPPGLADAGDLGQFRRGEGIFVSNNFAKLYGMREGSGLVLDTPSGKLAFKVLGSVDDYSWQHGAFIVDLDFLERAWHDDAISYIDASVAPGFEWADVKQRIQTAASVDRQAFAYDKAEIKALSDSVLEQIVSMANLQAMIAIFIGVLGIVNAIWIGVINRKREIALWRSIGLTRRQIYGIIVYESVFIAAVAALVGVVGGLYGGWVPLRSFSFGVTGYLYPCIVPWSSVLFVVVLAAVLGFVAGLFPASRAARLPVLESIAYE